jgi:hypothetical protein
MRLLAMALIENMQQQMLIKADIYIEIQRKLRVAGSCARGTSLFVRLTYSSSDVFVEMLSRNNNDRQVFLLLFRV